MGGEGTREKENGEEEFNVPEHRWGGARRRGLTASREKGRGVEKKKTKTPWRRIQRTIPYSWCRELPEDSKTEGIKGEKSENGAAGNSRGLTLVEKDMTNTRLGD